MLAARWTRALSMTPFTLDPRLAADTHPVGRSELSLLLLLDDARYGWCLLVPRRAAVSEVYELSPLDQQALGEESALLARAMARLFDADKMNVGALGNVVRQLHVHHVARRVGDPAWPGPVWGHSPRVPRSEGARSLVLQRLQADPALAARFRP